MPPHIRPCMRNGFYDPGELGKSLRQRDKRFQVKRQKKNVKRCKVEKSIEKIERNHMVKEKFEETNEYLSFKVGETLTHLYLCIHTQTIQ